jgi:hypothetical protein
VISPGTSAITIRPAYADDAVAIARLAALDSAPVPHGPLIVAEVDGELRVALAIADFTVIADPFHRTLELVALLRDHVDRSRRASLPLRVRRSPADLLRGRRLRVA